MGYLNSGIGAARINDSSPSDYTTYSGNKIETKQDSTDNTLTTTSKTIVGAINEVNSKVNNKFIVAQTLPVSDIDEFAIYLVPKSTAQTNNIYDEYIYISTDTPAHWEKIGDTEIDLSGYYTSSQVDNLLDDKQDATDNSLITTDKTIVGAINELHAINGYSYDAYDDTATYAVGDLCIYNNTLYKCTTAITTAEAWNASHWTATTIADEIGRIDTALSGKANIGNLFFGNAGIGFKSINGDATIDNIIDNNISSAGYFSIDHGGYISNLITTVNRQFIYGWANSNRQYSWCLICTFGGIWYCKRKGTSTYTATKLI